MLRHRTPLILAVAGPFRLASSPGAQGLTTTASKDDWEEINFEFNSSILSDGYPSLLRLAELLSPAPRLQGQGGGTHRLDRLGPLQRQAGGGARRDREELSW